MRGEGDWEALGGSVELFRRRVDPVYAQIEIDLDRTADGATEAEMASLRQLLSALVLRKPTTGYCQSMNFLGLCALRVLQEEERAFELLCLLTENVLPFYFVISMTGAAVDAKIFVSLIQEIEPELHDYRELSSDPPSFVHPCTCTRSSG